MNYKNDIKGAFKEAPADIQELARDVASNFHYRDIHRNEDGSLGSVKIGLHELHDILAFMAKQPPK